MNAKISIALAFCLLASNATAQSGNSTSFSYGTVVLTRDNGTSRSYRASADTDASRGTILNTAATALAAGDQLRVGPGTYALATSRLTLPDNVTLLLDGCTITSTVAIATGCIVRPGANNKIIGSGTIQGVAADGVIQAPIGWITSETPKTGVLITGIRMVADADGFYVSHSTTPCGVILRDCIFETEYDAVAAFSDVGGAIHAVDVYNPRIIVSGPSSIGTGISRGVAASYSSVLRVFGGSIKVTNGGATINAGAYAFSSGTVELYDVAITTSNGANPTADLWNSGSTLRVTGGKGSGANGNWTTSGAITYVDGITAGGGGGTPGGADTQVQYNDAGAFGGESTFTYNETTNAVSVRITPRVETLTDAATVTPTGDSYDVGELTELSQTTSFATPTGTPTNGQKLVLIVKSTTARAISFSSGYDDSDDLAFPTTTSGSSKTDIFSFIYNSTKAKWLYVGELKGF